MWKTYKEVYEEVLQIGSALRAVGAEPVNIFFYINTYTFFSNQLIIINVFGDLSYVLK